MTVSIRSRLLLLTLAWMLPSLAAGLWMVDRTVQSEREANERTLRETSRALATVVDREIRQRAAVARLLAVSASPEAAPALGGDERGRLARQAPAALAGLDGWMEYSVDGQLLLSTRPGPAPLPAATALAAAASGAAGANAYIDPLRQQADGVWRAAAVQAVQRGDEARATVAVTLLASELQRIIDGQGAPQGWVSTVIDSAHRVVASYPGGSAFAGRAATDDMRKRLGAAVEGLFESVSFDGTAVVGYYTTSPQGWTCITAMPRAEWSGYLQHSVLRVALGAALLMALAIGGAMWVSRGIVSSVTSLRLSARRMQTGQAVARRPLGITECDEVATALADASDASRHARADLQRQVQEAVERTRQAEQQASQGLRLEALGRLTGGLAHDFNNLLGVISNSAHLVQRYAAGTPELKVPVAATLRAVDVGSRLTQHLSRFAGQRQVRPQAVTLQRFLPDFEELLRSVVGKRTVVQIAVDGTTPAIKVDPGELELALINLALNAGDAMQEGGTIWLSARPARADEKADMPAGNYALISLSDDGNGIDPALAARVFEPFFTTKGTGRGTGLGLSQVHGFCRQAGGRASLASTTGGGTTVALLLPAADSTAAAALSDAVNSEADGSAPPGGTSGQTGTRPLLDMRVLLVEDNEELGDVTAALLESCGAGVQRAPDAAMALDLLKRGPRPDVVLTDIVMPGVIDGIAMAREIRRRDSTLPVVLISGYTSKAPPAGEFRLVHKPCTQSELVQALTQAIVTGR